jgi:RHS repeat-associated protein
MLGSSRVITTNTGVVCGVYPERSRRDADFIAFGFERIVTNSCTQNKYEFEGKERDDETGNDDFGARYYSNRYGRWLSADWSAVPVAVPYANLTNPQTLNLYAMVSDDPESFADLDGHENCKKEGGRDIPCGSLTSAANGDTVDQHSGDAGTANNAAQADKDKKQQAHNQNASAPDDVDRMMKASAQKAQDEKANEDQNKQRTTEGTAKALQKAGKTADKLVKTGLVVVGAEAAVAGAVVGGVAVAPTVVAGGVQVGQTGLTAYHAATAAAVAGSGPVSAVITGVREPTGAYGGEYGGWNLIGRALGVVIKSIGQ